MPANRNNNIDKEPSNKEDGLAVGVVIESLPNTHFRVELESGQGIMAYLSGKMRLNRIRVLVGDRVEVLLDPYGGKGRITKRL
jgi:translation initiation factor IF-1